MNESETGAQRLARQLVDEPPGQWPAPWRYLAAPASLRLPDRVRAAVTLEAAAGRRGSVRTVRRMLLPAAAVVLVALAFGIWQLRDAPSVSEVAVLRTSGADPGLGNSLALGTAPRRIDLSKQSRVLLGLPGGGALALTGPGSYALAQDGQGLLVLCEAGSLFVHRAPAQGSETGRLEWQTPSGVYRMQGTTARLAVRKHGDELQVLDGSFAFQPTRSAVASPPRPLLISAAERLRVRRADHAPSVEPLPGPLARELRFEAGVVDRVAAGRPAIDPLRRFASTAELHAHFGILHEVELTDGRRFYGFVQEMGNDTYVQTRHGVVRLPTAQIRSSRELQPTQESP